MNKANTTESTLNTIKALYAERACKERRILESNRSEKWMKRHKGFLDQGRETVKRK